MPEKKIPTSELAIGMYVSSLDRPWLETPFLLQGFPIQRQEEIDALRELCHHVYVMMPDEEIEIAGGPRARAGPSGARRSTAAGIRNAANPAQEEIETVHVQHDQLARLVIELEEALRSEKEPDLPAVAQSIEVMIESVERNPDAYLWLTRIKRLGSYFYRSSLTASVLAATLGRMMDLERDTLSHLALGTLLMDIGKTALPKELLDKPGGLSPSELALMKSHVEQGARILAHQPGIAPQVIEIVRTHHERFDGSGYPAALEGDQIPLLGQIAGIVDVYVAVTTTRPYARAISPSKAMYLLYEQRGRYFSDQVVEGFMHSLSAYPTGSLLELSSGEVGIVVSQNKHLRLKPNLILLLDPGKQPYGSYPFISLVDYVDGDTADPVTVKAILADGAYGLNIEQLAL